MDAEKRLTTNSALEELGCPHTEREHEALTLGLRILDESDPLLAEAVYQGLSGKPFEFYDDEAAPSIRAALLSGNGGKEQP